MADDGAVVDASAVLALIKGEPFSNMSADDFEGAVISAINYSEVLQKLLSLDVPMDVAVEMTGELDLTIAAFDDDQAQAAAKLWPLTKAAGLSLANRACIALGISLNRPILTADKAWLTVSIPNAKVIAIR